MSLFVDTSVWYAATDAGDISHQRAKQILRSAPRLVTSDLVLAESWRLIQSRAGYRTAESFWDRIRAGLARVERIAVADFDAVSKIGRTFEDQEFALVNRTSFAIMERLGIGKAASFDDDFLIFRYGPRRRNSFTVLR